MKYSSDGHSYTDVEITFPVTKQPRTFKNFPGGINNAKILIADDEPLVRAGIKSVIPWQQHGFEVIGEAENGLEAYNKIIALKPDILITDIKMPQMDGIELLKTIKKIKYIFKA